MKFNLHPYAIIFGVGIGIAVMFTLRHPLFALFFGIAATVLLDFLFKTLGKNKIDDDKDPQ